MRGANTKIPQEAMRGVVSQGTELVGGNLEDVDADIQSEPIHLHIMPKPSGVALSGTPISVTSGEGPSVPMT